MAINPNALTDAGTVQARLRLAAGTDQALIEQLINEASDSIERYCARKLTYVAACVEAVAPMGGPKLLLARTPLVSIASIAQDGETVPVDEYNIEDADAGIVHRDRGWPWSAALRPDLNFQRDQQPGSEKKSVTATYAGGYVSGVQVAGANAGAHPGLDQAVAYGKLIRPAGQPAQVWEATTAGNTGNGGEPVWPANPLIGQTMNDGAAVWTFTGIYAAVGLGRTLPSDLERACVLAAVAAYRDDQRNKNVKQETVGRASRTYAGTALPPEVEDLVKRYARWAA